MDERRGDPVFARAAGEHPTMSGLAGGGVRSDADVAAMIDALLALRDQAEAANLPGTAGAIGMAATALRNGRETATEIAARFRSYVADDRAREATYNNTRKAAFHGERASLFERAVALLTGEAPRG